MKTVTIYSTNTCHYCNLAKDFFKENNIAYTEHNVGTDMEKRQEMVNLTHQLGVPVIRIDDTVLVGFQESKVAELLELAA
ncbi:glutaredoxin family protein [Patescibacteria group bacterium]|nr:glutaredoxin family protein [Patescibacteria group bacterium]